MQRQITAGFIKFYRFLISPVLAGLGCRCRFHPSCSEYALDAFRIHPTARALKITALRVLKCGPWHNGGIDEAQTMKGSK